MPKKCIICNKEAKFAIKGSNEAYCEECAKENFADLTLLIKVEKEVQELKKLLK